MATVHSLPPEVLRHLLSLAYPPGRAPSYSGLCRTSLVHSTWREPSASLMTEHIRFEPIYRDRMDQFIETGPVGYSSESVYLSECRLDEFRAVLAKAKPGRIKTLALSGLENLLFCTARPTEAGRLSFFDEHAQDLTVNQPIDFSPWPAKLALLTVTANHLPPQLFTGSAQTLRKLDVYTFNHDAFEGLPAIAPSLVCLTEVVIGSLVEPNPNALSDPFCFFLAALPALAKLDLPRLTPHQLEVLLIELKPTQPLRHLITRLMIPDMVAPQDAPREVKQGLAWWASRRVPALLRCTEKAVVRGLNTWDLSVVVGDVERGVPRELDAAELATWDRTKEGWMAFRKAVANAGVKLNLRQLGIEMYGGGHEEE